MSRAIWAVLLVLLAGAGPTAAQVAERLGDVRVHGNHTTPDADILQIAGLVVGAPVTDATIREVTERLEQSGRFDNVDVRKRYRSIDDPNDILIVIVVDEVTGITSDDLTPGPFKKMRSLGMWLPVLDYDDGYGFTYGGRVTFVDALGKGSRISAPLTWGGHRQATLEVDRAFSRGPFTRVEGSASINRRVNPHYDVSDVRREVHVRAERALTSWLRIGGGGRLTEVDFADAEERFVTPSADVVVDTRTDPAFPRNAIHAVAGIEQLRFDGVTTDVVRWTTDVRGYIGLFGSSVLALRAVNIQSSDPVPAYEQSLLGGAASLRGYDFGYRAGDNLAAMSAEVRMPITSPLSMGKLGIKGFVDAGTVYAAGARLADQPFDRGVGVGAFMTFAVLRVGLDVAWPLTGTSHKPQWHFGLGVSF
jgi:outer membrane protein assembly factor BamA